MATPTLKKRQRLKTPALCFKSGPLLPIFLAGLLPHQLTAYCRWLDLDPLATADISTTAKMTLIDDAGNYHGQSPETENFIQCNLRLNTTTKLWRLEMVLFASRILVDRHEFEKFTMDFRRPLDTGLRSDVFISRIDERHCQVST